MNNLKPVLQFTLIIIIGALIVVGTTWVTNSLKKPTVVQTAVPVVVQPPQCPSDSLSYQTLVASGQSVELVKNLNTYAAGGVFVNDKTITVTKSGMGEVACGYLYVKAGVDGRALDPKYESIYVSPQGLGGQLLRSKTIVISSIATNTTEVLFPLNTVSYLPNLPYIPDAQNFEIANWAGLFNVASKINFHIGLSTLDARGKIDDVIIAYKCWDPSTTGQESKDCQLSVQ